MMCQRRVRPLPDAGSPGEVHWAGTEGQFRAFCQGAALDCAGVTPAALAELVRTTAADVLAAHGLDAGALPSAVTVERPRNPEHGDYATNVALRSAGKAGVPPRELAGWLAGALSAREEIDSAEVAGPGFLNLRLAADARGAIVREVLAAGNSYGHGAEAELAGRWISLALRGVRGGKGRPVIRCDGTMITMDDLVDAIGVDASRYAMARASADGPLEIDLDTWSKHTDDNPVFHVRYAHSRLASLLRNAADLGVTFDPAAAQVGLLVHDREGELVRTIGEYPRVVASAAELRQPYRVARYLEELAGACRKFHDSCRVLPLGDEPVTPLHGARLTLCAAARQVLANGLGLLGVSAPERM